MVETKRGIKSYVLRQGRLTPGQEKALDVGWPRFGLNAADGFIDPDTLFSSVRPVTLEIGFGMGESLAEQARLNPNRNFIGVEVHRPGIGHLLIEVLEGGLDNVRIYSEDSLDVLSLAIPDASIDVIQLFFPDPWPKKRHHKRRIVTDVFLDLAARKLVSGGILHIATDWQPYAEEIEERLSQSVQFEPVNPPERPETKFERRGLKLDHKITDLAYRTR